MVLQGQPDARYRLLRGGPPWSVWLLAMGLMLLLCVGLFAPAPATPGDPGIQGLRNKSRSIDVRRRALRQKKQQKLNAARQMTTQIVTNQMKLDRARRDLYFQQNRYDMTRSQIDSLSSSIDQSMGRTTRLGVDAGKRLRAIYTGSRINMLEVILDSRDLATFLDRLYYKKRLVEHDKKVLSSLRRQTDHLRQQRQQLASQRSYISQTIRNIQGLQGTIHNRLLHDRQLRDRYFQDARYYEEAENQLLSESRRLESEIRRLTAQAAAGKGAPVRSTGIFSWPIMGKITSYFGYRVHPIFKSNKMHTGLDISRPMGTPVKAADSGTVLYSGWRGGYGKVVMLNHGSRSGANMVTLYGHLSRIGAGTGAAVEKGQVIGAVGSTGYSTGPHLHFEIRENGRPVNPLGYLR